MDSDEEDLLLIAVLSMAALIKVKKKTKKKRRIWVQEWISRRDQEGCCAKLLRELRYELPTLYRNFVRMSHADFSYLLNLVTPLIQKQTTHLRKPIAAADRLVLTLRYLATGENFRSVQYLFRIPHNTISMIVPEVCTAIFQVLKNKYMKMPSNEEEWKCVAKEFLQQWNFPNCIGAIDGKHVVMVAPKHSGSIYFNYKTTHSIVLMAVVNANYEFIYIDVGTNGRVSDGGVFKGSSFYENLKNHTLHIPCPIPLPSRTMPMPYVLVGDDAFAMCENLLKPYSKRNLNGIDRIFNYRLSRTRRVVENAFGILFARFRVMRSPIKLNADKARSITAACCALHNYLIMRKSSQYVTPNLTDSFTAEGELVPGEWRTTTTDTNLFPLAQHRGYLSEDAEKIREEFATYFVNESELDFQYKHI